MTTRLLFYCLLFIFIGNSVFGRQKFSFDEISKEEFEEAFKNYDKYNNFPIFTDTVIPDDIATKIIQDARSRFEEIKDSSAFEIGENDYDNWFISDHILKFEKLPLYGFPIPQYPDSFLYCYDSHTGKNIDYVMAYPLTQSPQGIIVSQVDYDCDWPLDLIFYKYYPEEKFLKPIFKFYSGGVYSELLASNPKVSLYYLFWGNVNELYMSFPKFIYDGVEHIDYPHYFKITFNEDED